MNTDNIGLLTECPPVATSDSDGKFSLSSSILGIGPTVNQPAPEGGTIPVVVTSIVDLVVLKRGFVPLVMRDTVDVTVSDTSSFHAGTLTEESEIPTFFAPVLPDELQLTVSQ